MNRSNRRRWTVAVFAAMALGGAALLARGPVVVELAETFDAPEWQLGLVAPAGTVGYLVAVVLVGFGAGRLDTRRFVVAGLLGSGLALFAMGVAPVLAAFLLATVARGTMNGLVRGLNRPLLSHLYPEGRGRMYSYYDMTWALGATVGPLLVVGAVAVLDWRAAYYVLGGGTLLLGLAVWRFDSPTVETREAVFDRSDAGTLLGRPEVVAMAVVLFFGTGVEGGLFVWLPTYANGELPPALASVTLSVMVAGYVPGRFLYARLGDRVGYLRLLGPVLVLLVPAFAWTLWLAEGYWVLLGVATIGALVSGIFPLMISYGTDAVPQHSGPVTAIAAVTSSLGVGTVPAVMGFVISGSGVTAAMWILLVPLVVALVVIGVASVAERRRERRAHTAVD